MADALLTPDELDAATATLPDWEVRDGRLVRSFEFADFVAAFGFMTRVALVAEKLFHHPDWSNSWNRVDIAIVNHDAGGLTARCVELARRIDGVA
jgi:4a-hydroxytetrahydrobiopterin dehydratase